MQIWLAIRTCLKDKLFITGGRAGRAEFWWFTLFSLIVRAAMYPLNLVGYFAIIFSVISFLLFIGNYTVLVRRLHDTGRSIIHAFPLIIGLIVGLAGFLMKINLAVTVAEVIVGVSALYLLVLCALPGTKGPNIFGDPMPLGAKIEDTVTASERSQEPKAEEEVAPIKKKPKAAPKPQVTLERPKHQRKFK